MEGLIEKRINKVLQLYSTSAYDIEESTCGHFVFVHLWEAILGEPCHELWEKSKGITTLIGLMKLLAKELHHGFDLGKYFDLYEDGIHNDLFIADRLNCCGIVRYGNILTVNEAGGLVKVPLSEVTGTFMRKREI